MRFYNIGGGTIEIDGKNIYDYDLETLRGNMIIVPQDMILFGGTIEENIAYGKPDAISIGLFRVRGVINASTTVLLVLLKTVVEKTQCILNFIPMYLPFQIQLV